MRLVHYGSEKFDPQKFKPIKDVPSRSKPSGGLWASPVHCNYGWKEWRDDEGFEDNSKSFYFDFVGRIFTIDGMKDALKLPWKKDRYGLFFIELTQWLKNGYKYDAIHLTQKGELETRLAYPISLYGWDCECVLILNPKAIKTTT